MNENLSLLEKRITVLETENKALNARLEILENKKGRCYSPLSNMKQIDRLVIRNSISKMERKGWSPTRIANHFQITEYEICLLMRESEEFWND